MPERGLWSGVVRFGDKVQIYVSYSESAKRNATFGNQVNAFDDNVVDRHFTMRRDDVNRLSTS
jgi:hypothetical protein